MTGTLPKPKPYTLDCGHVRWLRIAPSRDDELWCPSCHRYEPLMLSANSKHGRYIDPNDEFWSERQGRKFKGGCLKAGCTFESDSESNWDALKLKMHTHYMREHTRFGALEIKTGTRLPPGSPPPF